MPCGRTHDFLTILLAPPAFGASYYVSRDLALSALLTASFIFGGVMFGPDLDTVSKQYSRWSVFKGLWLPYRTFFKHRSRWSHGLIFGTLIRVVYFVGVLTLGGFLSALLIEMISGTRLANLTDFFQMWRELGSAFKRYVGEGFAIAAFAGLWLGAASHTFTDMIGSYIKTGKTAGFL